MTWSSVFNGSSKTSVISEISDSRGLILSISLLAVQAVAMTNQASKRFLLRLPLAAVSSLLLLHSPAGYTGAPAQARPGPTSTLRIGGSSTVFPIMKGAIGAFRAAGNASQIDLKETGTSDGLRRFCSGQLEIANASRPINSKELRSCASNRISFIELPIAFDAITVVVNPANTWASQISTKELARLWGKQAEGRIKLWSDVNRDWPEQAIKLCGPGKDSGTYDYFNKAINGSPENSRQDYTASEDDNVIVRCVAQNPNALGYFGFSYYKANQNKLRALAVAAPPGPVKPTVANVQSGLYRPLSRPLFLYINDGALSSQPELQKFTTYAIRNGLRIVEAAGDVPLPASTYRLVESKLYKRITGSAFAGDLPIGLSIGEALRRSFDANKLPRFR
jgi:phosphate transport system substrate-binding protein